ncbi:WhiB family transcriptional regulator [Actinopolymorpha alba]|uniref:WhiB family transcriptional regulator n=1 Tax=Actinopolymorpha alba TaxID=533267 RepID=UPI00036E9CCE|nr:WhiB family transcriptional regulator [Actinopolymorpha alba]
MSRDYTSEPPQLKDVLTGEQSCQIAPDLFFPDDNDIEDAKRLCLGDDRMPACPVMEDCRHYALHHEQHGMWGGLSGNQLKKTRRDLGIRLTAPVHLGFDVFMSTTPEAVQKRAERQRHRQHQHDVNPHDVDEYEVDSAGHTRQDDGWCAA